MSLSRSLLACSLILLLVHVAGAWPKPRPAFLDQYRIGMLPYVYPYEGTTTDLDKVIAQGYDCIHIGVAAPYNGSVFSDINRVDAAITRCISNGKKVLLTISPRWLNVPWIGDTLNDGSYLQNSAIQNPNYAMLDVFDERQVQAYITYCRLIMQRYEGNAVVPGSQAAVVAYCLAWGYQAETGLFNGDFNTSSALMGSLNSGYSTYTLQKFNLWRIERNLPTLAAMPQPSPSSADFVRMMRFRYGDIARHFNDRVVTALRAYTSHPIGTFTYLDPSTQNYARNWTYGDALDFSRTAGITPAYYQGTALVDSGIGWEGGYQHQGTWDYTAACMERDEFRNLAIGNRMHGMYVREYDTAPQWEANLYTNISQYLITETDRDAVQPLRREVALYVPTWANALLTAHSTSQPFMPESSTWTSIGQYLGLLESFGVPYDLISDRELSDVAAMRAYRLIVVPAATQLAQGLEPGEWAAIAALPNLYQGGVATPSRTALRGVLSARGISPPLDYASDSLKAGMFNNFLWNWDPAARTVTVGGELPGAGDYTLGTHERKIVFPPLIKLTSTAIADDGIQQVAPGETLHARVADARFNTRPGSVDSLDVVFAPERGLDQNQLRLLVPADGNRSAYAGHPLQQSFTPSKGTLATVGIRGGKVFGYGGTLVVRVGTTLGGSEVAEVTLNASAVPDYADATFGAWLQVPINKSVTAGTPLYLQVAAPTGSETGARFAWAWDPTGPYARGAAYQAGVTEIADFCFFSTCLGDSVPAILTETGANTGVFTGSVATSAAAADVADGVLQLDGAQAVGAYYELWPCAMAWVNRTASDTQGPSTPSGVHLAQLSGGQVVLGWNPCSDPLGVTRYRVYRDGVQLAEVTYPCYALAPAQANGGLYTVVAYDRAGNASAASAPLRYGQWEFNESGFQEGWLAQSAVLSLGANGSKLHSIVSTCEPTLASPPLLIDTSRVRELQLGGSFAAGATALRVSWTTNLDTQWDEAKSVEFALTTPAAATEYRRTLQSHPQWKDTVTALRLSVEGQCSGSFDIDYLRLNEQLSTTTSVVASWFNLE